VYEGAPNALGPLALLAWGVVCVALFARFRPHVAATVGILGGALLLPVGIGLDLPGVPALNKQTLPSIYCLIACALLAPRELRMPRPVGPTEWLIAAVLASAFISSLTNSDPINVGRTHIPGSTLYDAFSSALRLSFELAFPFYLGRTLIRRREHVSFLLRAMVVAGLGMSLLALYEIRMSPRLHKDLYGFHQISFSMALRLGGYRPMVFSRSGLELAMLMLSMTLAAVTLARARVRVRGLPTAPMALYLSGVLVLIKSLGAMVYGAALIPAAFLLKPRAIARIAAVLAAIVLTYPLTRQFQVFPTKPLVDAAMNLDRERALSLGFRFDNEDMLLDKASQRVLFGWGEWGRNRIYDRYTGEDESVTDGAWIIVIGCFGVIGFLTWFLLLLVPVGQAALRIGRIQNQSLAYMVAGLSLIVATLAVDLIPNGFLSPFHLYLAGALAGALPDAVRRRHKKRLTPVLTEDEVALAERPPEPDPPAPR